MLWTRNWTGVNGSLPTDAASVVLEATRWGRGVGAVVLVAFDVMGLAKNLDGPLALLIAGQASPVILAHLSRGTKYRSRATRLARDELSGSDSPAVGVSADKAEVDGDNASLAGDRSGSGVTCLLLPLRLLLTDALLKAPVSSIPTSGYSCVTSHPTAAAGRVTPFDRLWSEAPSLLAGWSSS